MFEKLIKSEQLVEILYSKGNDYDLQIGLITEFDPENGLIVMTSRETEFIYPLSAVNRIRIVNKQPK